LTTFLELLPKIKDFRKLSNHADYHTNLEDHQWLLDLSFLIDLTGEHNEMNLELQVRANILSSVNSHLKANSADVKHTAKW